MVALFFSLAVRIRTSLEHRNGLTNPWKASFCGTHACTLEKGSNLEYWTLVQWGNNSPIDWPFRTPYWTKVQYKVARRRRIVTRGRALRD